MEKISQDLTMTTLRGDTDPLRVAAANSDCSDSRPQDPLNLNTTTSELQVLVHQLERRLAHKKVDRSRYRLSSEDFARLTGEYEQKLHWQESVRYDYFPDTQEVILHMPHRKHEVVGSRVGRLIQERIEQLYAKCQVECPFEQLKASDIKSDQGDVLMPDEQIMCLDAEQPALVVEVGNSQTAEDLERKARRLVMAGKGEIRQVVTVKFHRGSRVDLTVWRPRVIDGSLTPERVDQVIRDTNAEPVPGAQLGIPMAEMAPPELLHDSLRNEIIIITSEEICKVIKRAEAYHNSVGKNRFGVLPKDAECPSSPANSVSSGPSDDEEQQQESMPEDEYKPARRMRPGEPYRSPIKARARKVNKQD